MTRQFPLPLPHRVAMAADDFMVTDSNREAVGWIDQWPQWPAPCLVLYGPAGSGKTHLLNVWLARSQGRVLTTDFVEQATTDILQQGKTVAIDNAERLMGNVAAEEALFHLYNAVRSDKGSLLLTAATPPAQWGVHLPDLRSRLLASPGAAIAAPDDDLLSALLIKQFRDRQIDVGLDVIDFLLPRLERTPESARRIVAALDHASLAEGRRITVPLARRVLAPETGQE